MENMMTHKPTMSAK